MVTTLQPEAPSKTMPSSGGFEGLATRLKLLSNPHRLMILTILAESPQSVNSIHSQLRTVSHISQSSLSQHLALLRHHQVVSFEKAGQLSTYYITDHRIIELIRMLREAHLID